MKSDVDSVYNKWFADHPGHKKDWARLFYSIVTAEFFPKSIVDFGCGSGILIAPFEEAGLTILGVDGSKFMSEVKEIKENNYLVRDLREKLDLGRRYSLCFCFEVAEHIEEEYSEMLVDNLVNHSDTVLFTAAPIGQGGYGHINEKPFKWWVDIFVKKGYYLDMSTTARIKEQLELIPSVEIWYKRNFMVFRKGESSDQEA